MNKIEILQEKLYGNVAPGDIVKTSYAICFLKKLEQLYGEKDVKKLARHIEDENLISFVRGIFDKYPNLSDFFAGLDMEFEFEDQDDFVGKESLNDFENSTPKSLTKLCARLLEIKPEDKILDLCSGNGNFLFEISKNFDYDSAVGVENDSTAAAISKIKAFLSGARYDIVQKDAFVFDSDPFSKIFSNYPFGMPVRWLPESKEIVSQLKERSYGGLTSSDWAFNYKICSLLQENGKAVVITTNGSLVNSLEKQVREFFLKSSLVETVISLPEKLFKNAVIPVNVLVLSKNYKGGVRFVDARNLFVKGRRNNTLSDENIEEILSLCKADSKASKFVPIAEIFKEGAVLIPSRYLENNVKIENGIELGEVVKSIKRGAPLSASEVFDYTSEEPTNIQYLMLSNIKDGLIDEDLPYLKNIDMKFDKYFINDKNIVLSKNGSPFKIAVFERRDNQVLANGNMFIIEVDTNKMNPYYIKAFFDSETGGAVLKSISVGSAIPIISLEALKKILIPNIPLEEQQKIADIYLSKKREIESLKKKLNNILDSLNHLFD